MIASINLNKFNEFISTRSYVSGYTATAADLQVLEALGKAPAAEFLHALRWYNHIKARKALGSPIDLSVQVALESFSFAGAEGASCTSCKCSEAKPAAAAAEDDFDLFADEEEEDAEAAALKAAKIAEYNAKKAKKPVVAAKSEVELEVKPWGEDTDMQELTRMVKAIEMPGLVWSTANLVPLAYGIKKLVIKCVIEDDLVSVDDLQEIIQGFEDHVQSADILSFNKI
jgi:elongation factor 1-beta